MLNTERSRSLSIATSTIEMPYSIPSLDEGTSKLFSEIYSPSNEIHSPSSEKSPTSEENFNMKSFSHIQKEDLCSPTSAKEIGAEEDLNSLASEKEVGIKERVFSKNTLTKVSSYALAALSCISSFYFVGACANYTPGLDSEREDLGTPGFIALSGLLTLVSAGATYYTAKKAKEEVLALDPLSPIEIIEVPEEPEELTKITHHMSRSDNLSISFSSSKSRTIPPLERILEDETPRGLKVHRQNEEQDTKMRASTLEIRLLKEEEHEQIMTALEELLKEVQILLRENVPTLTEKDITLILADPTPTEKPAEVEARNSIMKVFKQRRISENFDIINVIRKIQRDKNNRDRDSIKKSIIHLLKTYIEPGSPRQVNISANLINKLLSSTETVFPDLMIKKNNHKEDQTLFPDGIVK